MDINLTDINVDWLWVKGELLKKEKIDRVKEADKKGSLLLHLDECLEIAKLKAAPKAISVIKNIAGIGPSSIELEENTALSSKELASCMKGAKLIYIFLVTLGPHIEKAATEYMNKNDHLRGYLLDRIGSFACESLVEVFEEKLRLAYSLQAMSVSMPFSPGYCDWPIEAQFGLAKLLDFSKAGVKLTESCMMVPKKSITAVIGIGPKDLFVGKRSRCDVCYKKECDYRRIG